MSSTPLKFILPVVLLAATTFARPELAIGAKAPELIGNQWTGARSSLAALRGKVVLLHFWTFGCINCKHNLPAYSRLQKDFAGENVAMIGIHTPETEEEHSFSNLQAAVKRLGVRFNSLFDDQNRNWNSYKVQYWPTLYVLDKKGIVKGVWVGELNFDGRSGESEVRALVAKLESE